jgi:hypothetical protein
MSKPNKPGEFAARIWYFPGYYCAQIVAWSGEVVAQCQHRHRLTRTAGVCGLRLQQQWTRGYRPYAQPAAYDLGLVSMP